MSHIFISYNEDEADFATVLKTELEKAGFDIWLDRDQLHPGADWSDAIDHGLRTASAIVLVLSPSSRASEYVTYEWSYAIGAGIPVVPVLRRDTAIHPRLDRLQHLDFRTTDARPWSKLVDELQSIEKASQSHWRPPRDAPSHIRRAVADLESGNSDDRHGAIDAISQWEHHDARVALQNALANPFNDVRAWAAIALAKKDDPAAETEPALRALTNAALLLDSRRPGSDVEPRTREIVSQASSALYGLGRAALDHLTQVAKSKSDPAQYYALELMRRVGGTNAKPDLIALMADLDPNLAASAIKQLGKLRATEAIPSIMRRMIEDATESHEAGGLLFLDTNVRIEAVRALVEMGDRSIELQLVAMTKHRVPTVRMCAAEVLGKLCGAAAIPVLADLLLDTAVTGYLYADDKFASSDLVFGSFHPEIPATRVTFPGGTGGLVAVAAVAAKALDDIDTPDAREFVLQYRRDHPRDGWPTLSVD